MSRPSVARRLLPRRETIFRARVIFGVWTVVGLFTLSHGLLSAYLSGRRPDVGTEILIAFLDVYQWALLTPLIFRIARRFPLRRGRLGRSLAAHLVAGCLVSALVVTLNWIIADIEMERVQQFLTFFGLIFHENLQWYAAVVGISVALDYYRGYRERELRASQLETQLAQARLEALRTQIQPHFLFNTLNTVSEVMRRDVRTADGMMQQLGMLLRLTFDRPSTDTVPLAEEMELLRAYVSLQQARFRDRLTVVVCVEPEVARAEVPNFILQPLVENAIMHGIARSRRPGRVEIRLRRRGSRLSVEVEDDGVGLSAGGPGGTGVGLANVAGRLSQLYGDDHLFELSDRPEGGALARMELPLRLAAPSEPAPALACEPA